MNKGDYICPVPFTTIEIQTNTNFLCCPSWLTKHLPNGMGIDESWNSKDAKDIRNSILDGSYKFCDDNQCPSLNKLKNTNKVDSVLIPKNELSSNKNSFLKSNIDNHISDIPFSPNIIQFSFDRTCNLKCPSCRIELIVGDKNKIESVNATIDEIEKLYSNDIISLYITGSGDPFISVGFREFLRNFNPNKYPNLKSIHLHTNATKWNRKMWDSMKSIHPYVKTCEISIDAGTKDTYENKTRLGGNWDELMDNLKFISTIPKLKRIKTSFVVQKENYKEMKVFYDLMIKIFNYKALVFFSKITNWGTFTDDEFKKHKIWDSLHHEHELFLKEVNRTLPAKQSFHNLQEFINKKKSVI